MNMSDACDVVRVEAFFVGRLVVARHVTVFKGRAVLLRAPHSDVIC